jgi:hypothetical protein
LSGFAIHQVYQAIRIPQIHTISISGGQVDQILQIIKLREIHIIFTSGFSGFSITSGFFWYFTFFRS